MKSWRSRAAAGLAIGAALLTIPLTAGSASAEGSHPMWRYYMSFTSDLGCQTQGNKLAQQGKLHEFRCHHKIVNGRSYADLYVR
ncbi:hypothetical protein [Streptomyces sp. NPDC054940]